MRSLRHYAKVLKSHDRRARFLVGYGLAKSGFGRFMVIDRGEYRLKLHNCALARQAWVYPERRRSHEPGWRRLLKRGDTVLDVRANIGSHALFAAYLVGLGGHVMAFKPHPRTYRRLVANIALNGLEGIVSAHQIAVTAFSGTVPISDTMT